MGGSMNPLAAKAAIKFLLCAVIAVFVLVALMHSWPSGFFKTALYVCAGGVCITLLWPSQDEGDALLNSQAD